MQFQTAMMAVNMKLEELDRKMKSWIEKKAVILADLDARKRELEIKYKALEQSIPTSPEAFLDFDQMQAKMSSLDLTKTWRDYESMFDSLKNQLESMGDSDGAQESKVLVAITNLSNDFAKNLEALEAQVNGLMKKYAVTEHGRLAREMREQSTFVKYEGGSLAIYKLPSQPVYQVSKEARFSRPIRI